MPAFKKKNFFNFTSFFIFYSYTLIAQGAPNNFQQLNLQLKKDLLINSSNLQYKLKEKKIYTKGETLITIGDYHFKSKSSTINLKKKELLFKNGVKLVTSNFTVKCGVLRFQLKKKTWQCKKAKLETKKHYFSGTQITKSKDQYQIDKASYTSCKVCKNQSPDWSLYSKKIIIKNNRGYIKIPTFQLKKIPIIAMPYLSFPVNTNRARGLLTPKLAYSKNLGWSYSQTFFLPFNIYNDLSINETVYSKKILKSNFEYRHIFKKTKNLKITFSHLLDSLNKTNYTGLTYQHYLKIKNSWVQRLSLQFISDPQYLQKFYSSNDPLLKKYGETALESKTSLSNSIQNENFIQHFNIEGLLYQSLLPSNLSFKKTLTHSFPNINYFTLNNKKLSKHFSTSFNLNLNNFSTNNKGFISAPISEGQRRIDLEQSKPFNPETDIITSGNRLNINPAIYFNFQPNNLLKTKLQISYKQLLYNFKPETLNTLESNYKKFAHQSYLNLNYFIKSNLYKIFSYKSKKYKHNVEPSIEISYTPVTKKSNHLFLKNIQNQKQSIFNNNYFLNPEERIQFDYSDNIQKANRVNFKLYTQLIEKSHNNYKHILDFQISQAFQIKNKTSYQSENLLAELNILINQLGVLNKTAYNYKSKLLNTSNHIYWISNNKNYKIDINYSNIFFTGPGKGSFNDKQENLKLTSLVSNHNWSLSGSVDLFKKQNQIRQVQSWDYKVSYKPNNQCWKLSFQQKTERQQDSSFHLNLNLNI